MNQNILRQSSGRTSVLIPMRVQDETNSLVFRAAGFVARPLQIAEDMLRRRALAAGQNPPQLVSTYFWTTPNRGDCEAVRTIYEKYKSDLLALAITLLKNTVAWRS
jgi:hypothetical protein